MDGNAVRFPSATDHFPDRQTNVVPIQLSMGAWNTLQQSDGHAYWEFNYTTNWIHPLYELPFTGGIPGTFEAGQVGALSVHHSWLGPESGVKNDPVDYGDNPNNSGVLQASGPRDPDKFDADDDSQREFRQRFIPSGLANEIFLDVYERLASFEPGITDFNQRLFDAYAAEVARVDTVMDLTMAMASSPRPKAMSILLRTDSRTTHGFSFRPRSSIASRSRGRSTTDCWRPGLPRARRLGYCRDRWYPSIRRCRPRRARTATIDKGKEADLRMFSVL